MSKSARAQRKKNKRAHARAKKMFNAEPIDDIDDCILMLSNLTTDLLTRATSEGAKGQRFEEYVACNRHPPVHHVEVDIDTDARLMMVAIDGEVSLSGFSADKKYWYLEDHAIRMLSVPDRGLVRAMCCRALKEKNKRIYRPSPPGTSIAAHLGPIRPS
jgi:hypothetical protein